MRGRIAIKFCGLTRPEDARMAGELGASYAGMIFAGGPRSLTAEGAMEVAAAIQGPVRRVGVMGSMRPEEMLALADLLALDVLQMHADPRGSDIRAMRANFPGEIWAVVRSSRLPETELLTDLADCADGVLVDGGAPGTPGGTGMPFNWAASAAGLRELRGRAKLIVAGGLRAENVAEAVRWLEPEVVDVSSGVESAPGIKDHDKMRLFTFAVSSAAGG